MKPPARIPVKANRNQKEPHSEHGANMVTPISAHPIQGPDRKVMIADRVMVPDPKVAKTDRADHTTRPGPAVVITVTAAKAAKIPVSAAADLAIVHGDPWVVAPVDSGIVQDAPPVVAVVLEIDPDDRKVVAAVLEIEPDDRKAVAAVSETEPDDRKVVAPVMVAVRAVQDLIPEVAREAIRPRVAQLVALGRTEAAVLELVHRQKVVAPAIAQVAAVQRAEQAADPLVGQAALSGEPARVPVVVHLVDLGREAHRAAAALAPAVVPPVNREAVVHRSGANLNPVRVAQDAVHAAGSKLQDSGSSEQLVSVADAEP